MFKRIKRMWQLSKKEPKAVDLLAGLTDKQIMELPDEGEVNGVFIGAGTEEEYKNFKREEDGTKKWYDRLKNL